ncbi:aspartate aminotransferase family protein [Asticcacaulis sp. AND118]|uniref:aspartate aminotransferase family protein n=1 Tax=Asticcacaulis sp. AND118 TaxID=2840468 RepID=UPI001CFFE936|nr:aspartate aminotransferase family protein [Asticcacaulis sp. AND118]UDF02779.1 aspartate aminotransferase family protein [Asticcacaulis sp. AND118]
MSLTDFLSTETERFNAAHPRTLAFAAEAQTVWRGGVPLHWMHDWASPVPLYAERAKDATLWDVDGHAYDDFCLGDTPSMFGHGREELQRAIAEQAGQGVGFMLPTRSSLEVGQLLKDRFGLPVWQCATTASDANRAVIRWARAITRRSKILFIDGAYHGMVDDAFVVLKGGRIVHKTGLIGQVADLTQHSVVVPFNDLEALSQALQTREIAAVMLEPVMTNCGMILPIDGYHDRLRALCDETGTLLVYDETHTLSSGFGGYVHAHGLRADILTVGKAIAGGVPAAVWGVSAEVAARMDAAQAEIGPGASGIGTTLSGNALAMAGMKAMLTEIMTPDAYAYMQAGAESLVARLRAVIARHAVPWSVVHVGARAELVFAAPEPQNAERMRRALDPVLLKALHLYLINRGVLIAPFHNMMLISPKTAAEAIDRLVAAVEGFITEYKRFTSSPA